MPEVAPEIQAALSELSRGSIAFASDGGRIMVVDAYASQDLIADEAARGQTLATASRTYTDYGRRLEKIQQYRDSNAEFDRLLFKTPTRLAVTALKAVVRQPRRGATKEEMKTLQRRVTPPYTWFNEHVNQDLAGTLPGARQVMWSLLYRLLEGSVCGYRITFADQVIDNVKWRVPVWMTTHGGTQIKATKTKGVETWTVRDESGPKPAWVPLANDPKKGVYGGVIRLDHPVGDADSFPTPTYWSLMDTLMGMERMIRGDLASLHQNERTIVLWFIDTNKALEAGVPLVDTTDASGNTVSGVTSIFNSARQAARTTGARQTRREYTLHDWIKAPVEVHPDFSLLTAAKKMEPWELRLAQMAGLRFAPDGTFLKEETEKNQEVDFQYYREHYLEPAMQIVYDLIREENIAWFGRGNGTPGWSPFMLDSQAAGKRGPKPTSATSAAKRKQSDILDRLDGVEEIVSVRARLAPSSAKRDSRLQQFLQGARMGVISATSVQEVAGVDPDLERQQKRDEWADTVELEAGKVPVTSPSPSNVQTVVKPTGTETNVGRQSPGRVPGSKQPPPAPETPPDTEV